MSGVTGIVLAGGQSRRMGQHKALMPFGGRPLIGRVIDAMQPVCASLLLVTNSPDLYRQLGLAMVPDAVPGAGSLGGLYSGLAAMQTELGIAVACDMPFLNSALLEHMVSLAVDFDVVIPDLGVDDLPAPPGAKAKQRDLHPMHAVYRSTCIRPIEAQMRSGDLRMIGYFDQVRVRALPRSEMLVLDPDLLSVMNVNTPDEWAQAEALLASRPG